MKITNDGTIRLGGTTYPPSSQTEEGFHDLPEGKGLESLLAMGAVTKMQQPKAEKKGDGDKP